MGGKGYRFFLLFIATIGLTLRLYSLVPPERANLKDLNHALSILQKARKEKNLETANSTTMWLRKATSEVVFQFLRKNFCNSSEKDVQDAFQLVKFSRMFSPSMEEGITRWLRMGFRAYASRKFNEGAAEEELTQLGKKALAIGLGDVAEALTSGKTFPSWCREVWYGNLIWAQKSTPPVESVDIWNEMKISIEFHISVAEDGKIHGVGSGKIQRYTLKIVCSDMRKKPVPVKFLNRLFPVIFIGNKGKNVIKIKPVFQAQIGMENAFMECSESDVGEVPARTIDLGKILSDAIYFYENNLFTLPISGNSCLYKSPDTGVVIHLTRLM